MPTKEEIISKLSPPMRRMYRELMVTASQLNQVLVWSGNPNDYELEVISYLDANNITFMEGKVILFDGREK